MKAVRRTTDGLQKQPDTARTPVGSRAQWHLGSSRRRDAEICGAYDCGSPHPSGCEPQRLLAQSGCRLRVALTERGENDCPRSCGCGATALCQTRVYIFAAPMPMERRVEAARRQPEQHAQHTLNTEYHGKYDSLSRLRERDSDPGTHARLFYLSHLRGAQLRRVAGGAGKRGTVDRVRKGSRKPDNGEVTPTAIGREVRQPWRTGAPLVLCQTDKALCPLP